MLLHFYISSYVFVFQFFSCLEVVCSRNFEKNQNHLFLQFVQCFDFVTLLFFFAFSASWLFEKSFVRKRKKIMKKSTKLINFVRIVKILIHNSYECRISLLSKIVSLFLLALSTIRSMLRTKTLLRFLIIRLLFLILLLLILRLLFLILLRLILQLFSSIMLFLWLLDFKQCKIVRHSTFVANMLKSKRKFNHRNLIQILCLTKWN